jgi:hypothetical protein
MRSLDEMAQRSVRAAEASVRKVDPMAQYETLELTAVHRRRSNIIAGTLVVVLAVGTAVWGLREVTAPTHVEPAPPTVVDKGLPAGSSAMRDSQLTWPATKLFYNKAGADTAMDFYRADGTGGISILEHVIPAKNDGAWSPDPAAGTTARDIATWASRRPFLTDTGVTRVEVDGRPAWRVTGTVAPGATLGSQCDAAKVGALLETGAMKCIGYADGEIGELTLLDVPGSGVVAIWSWNTHGNAQAVGGKATRDYVASLHFAPPHDASPSHR